MVGVLGTVGYVIYDLGAIFCIFIYFYLKTGNFYLILSVIYYIRNLKYFAIFDVIDFILLYFFGLTVWPYLNLRVSLLSSFNEFSLNIFLI